MNKALITLAIIFGLAALVWAAGFTDYSELDDHAAGTDLLLIQDVSDTTMAAAGTTKRIEVHSLFKRDVRRIYDQESDNDYTVTADDCGVWFTNAGATAITTATLLVCDADTEGNWWVFYTMDADYDFRIAPNAANSIADFSPNEDGEYIYNDKVVGTAIMCQCMRGDDGEYDIYTTYTGVWTAYD